MSGRHIYRGRIVDLDIEPVVTPAGHRFDLEIVRHPGGAAAVILDASNRVCLLRQYRYVIDDHIWELPAGKLEPEEPPLVTAQREAQEEAGVRADEWHSLGQMYSSPGVFTEVIHLYLATGIHPLVETDHEPEESIEVHWIDFAQAMAWCDQGQINDAKSLAGLYRTRAWKP
jgi:ADP-ribose pyrophosphatase